MLKLQEFAWRARAIRRDANRLSCFRLRRDRTAQPRVQPEPELTLPTGYDADSGGPDGPTVGTAGDDSGSGDGGDGGDGGSPRGAFSRRKLRKLALDAPAVLAESAAFEAAAEGSARSEASLARARELRLQVCVPPPPPPIPSKLWPSPSGVVSPPSLSHPPHACARPRARARARARMRVQLVQQQIGMLEVARHGLASLAKEAASLEREAAHHSSELSPALSAMALRRLVAAQLLGHEAAA